MDCSEGEKIEVVVPLEVDLAARESLWLELLKVASAAGGSVDGPAVDEHSHSYRDFVTPYGAPLGGFAG